MSFNPRCRVNNTYARATIRHPFPAIERQRGSGVASPLRVLDRGVGYQRDPPRGEGVIAAVAGVQLALCALPSLHLHGRAWDNKPLRVNRKALDSLHELDPVRGVRRSRCGHVISHRESRGSAIKGGDTRYYPGWCREHHPDKCTMCPTPQTCARLAAVARREEVRAPPTAATKRWRGAQPVERGRRGGEVDYHRTNPVQRFPALLCRLIFSPCA